MRHILLAAAGLLLAPSVHAQTAAPPAAAAIPVGRLTDAVMPRAYRLDLSVDPDQPRFSGRVEIDAVLKQSGKAIFLHGNGLAMHKATATAGGRTVAAQWRQVDQSGVAQLTFAEALPAGPVTLAFEYDAPFNDGPAGLFRVKVGGDWYSWSQFQSIDARAAFPSFDEPGFKTPFTVTLRTPPGLTAVSNAPQVSQASEGGKDVHRFAATLPLPTYLVAMMVGPFAKVEGTVPATPQRQKPLPLRVISTRPNAAKLDFALQGSKDIVALLEDYFADGFPYPKLDQITSPIMPGAMENAGADLYDDAIIVMDANASTPQKRRFGMVVAHELAHQWFGDLVTPAWWDDIWLNESFANWMGYRIGDAWRPDLNIRSGALAEGFTAMDTDALLAGRPIRQKIETNAQINAAFDNITYGKGGHVVAMIAAFMGDAKFRDGVRRYMAAHRFANATSDDFFGAMAEAAGDPRIVPAMRSFTDQQGVPLLTFSRAADGGFTVRQSRYAAFGTTAPAQRWGVPLCVRRDGVRQCQLLTEDTGSIAIPGTGPLVPNADGTGYYRFELPAADWNALIANAASLNGGEALALADSLSASVWADRASVGQLAELARRLASHPDSYAAEAGAQALTRLVSAGFAGDGGRLGWRRLVNSIYRPLLKQYGFDPRAGAYAGEDPEKSQRRVQTVERLVSTGRHKALRKQLDTAAKQYLAGDVAALDPAWFNAAFGVYLDGSGALDRAKTLIERALASEDPAFRPEALDAVGGSNDKAVARWVLEDLRDPRLRSSESRDMLRAIVLSGTTRDIGYDWMHAHLDELLSGGGIFFTSRLPQMLARFCSVQRADQFAADLRPRLAGKTAALELERVLERVRACGRFRDARGQAIAREFAALK